jgi:hypothetical protein
MRKALFPMLASLVLCGAGTAALIATTANAETTPRNPVMTLVGSSALLAQNMPAPAQPTRDRGDRDGRMKARCQDNYARETGRIAYIETRLNLTATQRPLFGRWKDVQLTIAKRHADECGQRMTRGSAERPDQASGQRSGQRSDPVARMDRQEAMLKQRLADLDAQKPVFAALYNGLSAEQRESFRPGRDDFGPGPGRGLDAGRGPGRGPRGPMNDDRPPPPPPPM